MLNRPTTPLPTVRTSRWISALLMLALILPAPLLRAAVSASLDRSSVYSGDTVTLTIETSGDDQGRRPDLAPLQRDFTVLGTSRNQQIEIINGRRSNRSQWLIELAPRHTGALQVPALSVGDKRTAALDLQVSEPPAAATALAGQPVFIRSEISPATGDTYVQQQVLYTTRLYYRVPLIEGDFNDPALDTAAVERLGDDHQYQTTVDGQRYQVLERRYAIFPEHSGTLAIPPVVFSGRTVSPSAQQSPLGRMDAMVKRMLGGNPFTNDFFAGTPFGDPGKRVQLRGNALSLPVKPRPVDYTGRYWLPSQQLELDDSWADSQPKFRSGEPVTRTLTLEAKGLEAAQLPDIRIPETTGLRVYPEQPVQTNRTDGDWIYGRSEQTFAFQATKPGPLTLPRIQVDWWDSVNHQQRSAILPARQVVVAAGASATSSTAAPGAARATPATTASTPASRPPVNPASENQFAPAPTAAGPAAGVPVRSAPPMYVWLIAGAVLLMLLAAVRPARSPARQAAPAAAATPDDNGLAVPSPAPAGTVRRRRQQLREACARNDSQAAARALLDWSAAVWPNRPPRTLGALARRVAPQSARDGELIGELERVLYSAENQPWHGESLWQALVNGLPPVPSGGKNNLPDGAPPLYPDWTHEAG